MKTVLKVSALVLLSILVFSCVIQRRTSGSRTSRLDIKDTTSVKDPTEYELIVFDPSFDFWLERQSFYKN